MPPPQFFLQACLAIVSLASVPTFHFTTSFCSQNPSPKSQIRGAFLYCKLRLIVMSHPSSQGWKQTYGKVFWRQSCCLMKMTGLRLMFLLPDVEAGPSHVPDSWGGTGCLELSIFLLPPGLPCWDYCPRPHPPCRGPVREDRNPVVLPVTTAVTMAVEGYQGGGGGRRGCSSPITTQAWWIRAEEGSQVLPGPVWTTGSSVLTLVGLEYHRACEVRADPDAETTSFPV